MDGSLTGVPWTEEEHKLFLLGLQKVGIGNWRGISSRLGPQLKLLVMLRNTSTAEATSNAAAVALASLILPLIR